LEGDADRNVVGVVADAAFVDGLAGCRLDQGGVGDDLEPVGGPGLGLAVDLVRAAAFVLVGDPGAVTASDGVDSADETKGVVLQVELGTLAVVIGGGERGVQFASGEDTVVGDANLLDLFEVEESSAVG
jgi:hypothetical protein